jgi:uncharacterized membrane protein YhaH (DUF805 family)
MNRLIESSTLSGPRDGSIRYILILFASGRPIILPTEVPMSTNPFDTLYEPPRHDGEMTITDVLFGFDGRIPRRVYWGYSLGMGAVFYALILGLLLVFPEDSPIPGLVMLVSYIPLVWISLALQVKRWHDRGQSGWMVLVGFIPVIGAIWSFVELGCLRGTIGSNAYGADPT